MAHEHHHHDLQTVTSVFKISILLNLAFVLVEFMAGLWADSVGLMSDAGHNLSDVASLVIAWVAFSMHSEKATLTASYINIALLLAAVAVIFIESISKIFHPGIVRGWIMIAVAGIGVVVNMVTTLLLNREKKGDINIRGAFLHMLADTLVSVGVVVSGIVIIRTGLYVLDAVIGLVVGIIILLMTIHYLRDVIQATKKCRSCQVPVHTGLEL